jgi:putative redox protein
MYHDKFFKEKTMVEMKGIYVGEKHCDLVHGPSGTKIATDAPKDNQGKGEAFSPTDLMGAALGSCILTTMAIVAERDGVSLSGARFTVGKEMQPTPRKIARLALKIEMPAGIPESYRPKLEVVAHSCPVAKSLNPDIEIPVEWIWK